MREIEDYFAKQEEPQRSCLLALRSLILDYNGHMSETMKYGMPCYCYREKVFSYLWVDKKTSRPYILVVRGRDIEHPSLEQGDRSKMKRILFDPSEDIPVETISEVFDLLIPLYD